MVQKIQKISFAIISSALITACSPDIEEASDSFKLTPTGPSLPLTDKLRTFISQPDVSLSVNNINVTELSSKSGVKNKTGSELYIAKSIVNVKLIVNGLASYYKNNNEPEKEKALAIISKHISDKVIITRPAHQFLINNKLGNRIIFYGADNELENGPGHKNIDALAHEINMPIVKVMTHFKAAQGGSISEIIEDTSGGIAHVGGYSASWYNNKPTSVRSDWPADYGNLNDDNRYYNAHLLAIDYQAGTNKEIPEKFLSQYHKNYKLWDALTGLIIPYTTSSKINEYQDYKNNPLEVTNIKSLKNLAKVSATLDKSKINFTSYCAEGIWNVANLAVNIPIIKNKYPAVDKFITNYQSAPAFKNMNQTEREHNPELGWVWLHQQGLISDTAYQGILQTHRNTIYLDWVSDDLPPWTKFQPQRKDGLIADSMTLGTLVRMLIRTYYPRESVTKAIITAVKSLYQTGDKTVKTAIETFLNGFSPTNFIGNRILFENAYRMASAELSFIVQNDFLKNIIFKKLGYEHIVNFEDQEKVDQLFSKYVQSITDPELIKRKDFDQKLASLDKELANMKVKMMVYGPNDKESRTKEKTVPFFMWTPPQTWVYWAQHPNAFNSRSIRYVTTAMHYEQSKEYESAQ